ncbi:MAG: hypothetical protein ACYCX7_04405, partial [Solirubrobacteraceae bacterium]
MHQTTVRFASDLWNLLEVESERLGISAAHYVRDAALARLAYEDGSRDGRRAAEEKGPFGWAAWAVGAERAALRRRRATQRA